MIELAEITLRNFKSYGDYQTTVRLDQLGACLVVGESEDNDQLSNGAGKTSLIVDAITWLLFGRLPSVPKPGDKVVNKLIGKNCFVSGRLKNGDVITRTCRYEGKSELTIEKDGDIAASTLSTSTIQQPLMARQYDLDWGLFSTSCCISGRSWVSISDAQRKQIIERLLRMDRLSVYAAKAKEWVDSTTGKLTAATSSIATLERDIERYNTTIADTVKAQEGFEDNKTDRAQTMRNRANSYRTQAEAIEEPNVESLQKRWDMIKQIEQKLAVKEKAVVPLNRELNTTIAIINERTSFIQNWRNRSGITCSRCEQIVPEGHVASRIDPVIAELEELQVKQAELQKNIDEINKSVEQYRSAVSASQPKMTVSEAQQIIRRKRDLLSNAAQADADADAILNEENPHLATITRLKAALAEKEQELAVARKSLEECNLVLKHWSYLYKAYSDRRKIKSHLMAKRGKLLNEKLAYYLDKFKLDKQVTLTDVMGLATEHGPLEFLSSGEKTRVNVALAMASFSVQELLWGRQSNFLILDEVDSHLCEFGLECFIDVVCNDLATRVDSVIVVSHRAAMRDRLPHQITVRKTSGFSRIAEIR